MKPQRIRFAWGVTAVVIIVLAVATFQLARLADSAEILVGKVVVLGGPNSLVFLRAEPNQASDVVTTVPQSSSARVVEFIETAGGETWYLVETVEGPGWVPALIVTRPAPEITPS